MDMTREQKDRFWNAAVSLVVAISGVLIAANLSANAAQKKDVEEQLRKKADIEYVDKTNQQLKELLKERDKVNTMILEELHYIRTRVDKIANEEDGRIRQH